MMLARGSGDQWGTFDGAYRSAGTNLQGIGLSLLSMVRATSGGAYLLNGAIDGNFPNTRGQVGNIGGIAGQELVGKIGEIIVIEGSVPAYLSAAIEGYLSHKWGIEGFLPTLHPYKNTPPRFDTGGAIQASKVSGIVQIDGTPAERTVRAFGYSPTVQDIDGESLNLSKSLGHATSDPETGEYTIDLLDGYDQRIFVVAFDDYGADFKPDLAVAVGDRVHPTTPNGHVWECTGSGTLPSEEPAWVIDTETDQLYGTASMIARPFYRPMVHGPVTPEVVQQDPAP